MLPFEIDGRGRSARIPPPLVMMMMRLLLPVKNVLVDQETGVLMKLGEQLPLMMMLPAGRGAIVILANERIDDRDPHVRRSRVTRHTGFDVLPNNIIGIETHT